MIDVHAVNKKKAKKVHRFLHVRCKQNKAKKVNQKNKYSINQSPQLLILSDFYSLQKIYFATPKSPT